MRSGGFTERVPGVVATSIVAVGELEPPHAASNAAVSTRADGVRILIMPNSLLPQASKRSDARGQPALLYLGCAPVEQRFYTAEAKGPLKSKFRLNSGPVRAEISAFKCGRGTTGAARESGVYLAHDGDPDRLGRHRTDVDADRAAQSHSQPLGRGTEFLRDPKAPRGRTEQAHISRGSGQA